MDCRLPENRKPYFDKLYDMNLRHGVLPGLVYLYMPELAKQYNWDDETKLWFAFLNGNTQNPITSMQILEQLPECPKADDELTSFTDWFNDCWKHLQFDTDRKYQKKDLIPSIKCYAKLVAEHGTQAEMLSPTKSYTELWDLVFNKYYTFGRLSSFSYLEYVYLNGFGTDCDDLLFQDKSGSKSHRNGMLFLLCRDDIVWDKRLPNGFDGSYTKDDYDMVKNEASKYLQEFSANNPDLNYIGNFTMESCMCTFKNHFFGHRYPGVYADMAWERIVRADNYGLQHITKIFKDMRMRLLPEWLRMEAESGLFGSIKDRAMIFTVDGFPFRGEHFLNG